MIWVDIRRATNRPPFHVGVACRCFDNVIDAREWANEQLAEFISCHAIISDDSGVLYRIRDKHPPEPALAFHSFGVDKQGRAIVSTD